MDASTRRLVRHRAAERCEYCRLPQAASPWALFQIEHIRPIKHHGTDELSNLCLACGHCNRHKGPNLASVDPVTSDLTPLFNPRTDDWVSHFRFAEHRILGLTAIGRVTVDILKMNAVRRVELRIQLAREGLFSIE
jgi:hypothetical protein